MNIIEFVKKELEIEAKAITEAAAKIDGEIEKAVELLLNCRGKIVVTGMGKTGLIGRKISATLASTGSTSIFLHAAEGIHGDLGIISSDDVVIAISNSGNTSELVSIIPYIKFNKIPIIALTGNRNSKLGEAADVFVDCSVRKEYEPFGLVPTASTTVALAIGDAIAVALLKKRNFCEEDFARYHPGGTIGKRLLLKVRDLMHAEARNPICHLDSKMGDVIMEMTSKGLGCTHVVDKNGFLLGIITDGDLRRLLSKDLNALGKAAQDAMHANPTTISAESLAIDALNLMEELKITMLPVIAADKRPIG
ncbi:MAG: KpsF/GutQ family sugar-phosphate isomerase, partial [Candidatus Cloacimonadales bacterium]